MAYFKHAVPILLSCLLIFFITGCLKPLNPTPAPTTEFSPDLAPSQYATAIENLQAITRNNEDSAARQSALLHLAWLYSSYQNPARDYDKALEQIDQYLVDPAQPDGRYNAKNLQSLLTLITTAEKQRAADLKRLQVQVDQLQTKAGRLAQANQSLTEQNTVLANNNRELSSYNKSLLKKNKALEETIEKLKSLEMQLEQKRKSFK